MLEPKFSCFILQAQDSVVLRWRQSPVVSLMNIDSHEEDSKSYAYSGGTCPEKHLYRDSSVAAE
jgi:hypothetical protein